MLITALNNLDSVIDRYQTCVFLTTCESPTDTIRDYLNADRVRKSFVVTSFFLVAAVGDSLVFFGVITVNIFSSVNKFLLTSLDEYFSNCFKWLSFAWQFAPLSAVA